MQNVFLVEDSPALLERLSGLLAPLPGTSIVGQARSAEDAISGILARQPDIVVLDLSLASGSGFEVLSAVHRAAPHIDFYVLSNFASEPYRRHASRLGARDFFDKTNDFERVRDVIAQRAQKH
jgi:DNA-binding NarL/FixJ family response regulator